ncbi:hypothetical protein C9397_15800 [Xanthomonas vasicola pv. vasculorum]|uniref:Uncharacterized protein n=1 Tax=Xanthomonas vasicola pv. vasculorum TaxID=325776 RepID=A0AAE8JWF0_XANVA|nr:hypothetical protein C7V42_07590 [Xanthomonas vasicola pv. vasculorum]TWQ16932.1 hypothetical protein FQK00_07685 [Xanthomonas vasicola]AZM70694.1 hypothetical protein CXP37_07605 [Xanthomonas vasicola pv. vasculorum]OWF63773.1 hypothetical protein B1H41_04230 [Xanthomonas vasicola pv. vasculorum]OWF63915.1 hypothetical protein B1H32_02650 [Xanthomonas vasicola pv. vasculorum]
MKALGFAQAGASGTGIGDWALGIGHWALGIGHWALRIRNGGVAFCGGARCDADNCSNKLPTTPLSFVLANP